MTLVVTHANGFLGCFTRERDGSMKQRALIDTGEQPPTAVELAELGMVLANQWNWDIDAPASLPKVKAAPTRKPKRPTQFEQLNSEQRLAAIVDYVRDHPGSTGREVVAGLGYEPTKERMARWHHQFKALVVSRIIIPTIRTGMGNPNEYVLATPEIQT